MKVSSVQMNSLGKEIHLEIPILKVPNLLQKM